MILFNWVNRWSRVDRTGTEAHWWDWGGLARQQSSAVCWRSSFLSHPEKAELSPQAAQTDFSVTTVWHHLLQLASLLTRFVHDPEIWRTLCVKRRIVVTQRHHRSRCGDLKVRLQWENHEDHHEDYTNHDDSVGVGDELYWIIRWEATFKLFFVLWEINGVCFWKLGCLYKRKPHSLGW